MDAAVAARLISAHLRGFCHGQNLVVGSSRKIPEKRALPAKIRPRHPIRKAGCRTTFASAKV
jgi:hypothetical protein